MGLQINRSKNGFLYIVESTYDHRSSVLLGWSRVGCTGGLSECETNSVGKEITKANDRGR